MAKAKGKTANIFVWIILGLLIVGLAGFGVDGFGTSVQSIGRVGDREIRTQDYYRALQEEMRAIQAEQGGSFTFAEAREMGIDSSVRARLVTIAAIENEAERLGISVGDEIVSEELTSIPAFQGLDGRFNREAYRFALQQQGLSEGQFEDQMRMDTARSILQSAVVSGLTVPDTFTDALHGFIGERRTLSVIPLDRGALSEPLPSPSEAELRAYYDANEDEFTLPEARRITYAWITPSMIIDTVEVDETAMRELYESRSDEFARPERRLVERLIYNDEDTARAAMERIESGEADFADLVAERGLDLEDTDLGDIRREELDDAAASAVFELDEPGVVGPFDTAFGPAIYRMNAILSAQETGFEEAQPELRDQLARDRARRVIADQYDDYEDLLAGGATLEDLARETEMQLGEIDFRPDSQEGIAGYETFREEAERVEQGDFPQIHPLDDGGLFALRLEEIVPPQPEPFEDVTDRVIAAWEGAEVEARLSERAEEIANALRGGQSIEELELTADRIEAITRNDFVQGIPSDVITTAFEMEPQTHEIVAADGGVHVVTLEEVLPPETDTPEAQELRENIADQARQALTQDLFSYYARKLESEAGIRLDNSAIEAVHQQLR